MRDLFMLAVVAAAVLVRFPLFDLL
jgi:hypothetical protein